MAQETIHIAKIKDINSMVLKIDLAKAYDKVDWSLLHSILINAGLDHDITQWIMGSVTSTKFDV